MTGEGMVWLLAILFMGSSLAWFMAGYSSGRYAEQRLATAVPRGTCTVPPAGWYCTREAGHDGPCAAVPRREGIGSVITVKMPARFWCK